MISYMDLIQNCFYSSTKWSWDNTYEHILETPRNLLHFQIPNGFSIIASNRNTKFNYSSINISQIERLEGSLSYLSTSTDLDKYYKSSSTLPLNNILQGYRNITKEISHGDTIDHKPFLLYGKIYFPSQFIEGMIIKRFTPNHQLIVKFVNTPKLNKLTQTTSIFTFYLQRQTENSSHDFIYSTREALFGFRCLYHFNLDNSPSTFPINKSTYISSKIRKNYTEMNPSTLSLGCELWYSVGSVSPGVSIASRYTTYIDTMRYLTKSLPSVYSNLNPIKSIQSIPYAISCIHPLTFTFAVNPLLGTFESTYAIRSDAYFKTNSINDPENSQNKLTSYIAKMGIVLSSKYQFNIYSYDSDLIVGAQILRSKLSEVKQNDDERSASKSDTHDGIDNSPKITDDMPHIGKQNVVYKVSDKEYTESNNINLLDVSESFNDSIVGNKTKENNKASSEYKETADEDAYITSLKISGNITKQNMRVAWEGKFYDWFVSSGVSVDMKGLDSGPRILKYGVEFSYIA